ncbi:hypothetical protein [Halomonas gemina]|uniref:hypothetical protein n=1 Tax=Halomonas gemina TaxID=2945105 RepID=UPI00201FBFE5|nr:hypothetical protein [Halomonas gemina]
MHHTLATNDKQQVIRSLMAWQGYPEALVRPTCLWADTSYLSAANVQSCDDVGIDPLLTMKRYVHHLPLFERFVADPPGSASEDPVEEMAYLVKTHVGRALYALRILRWCWSSDQQDRDGVAAGLTTLPENVSGESRMGHYAVVYQTAAPSDDG